MRSDKKAEVWASGSSRLQGFELSDFETPVEYPSVSEQENSPAERKSQIAPRKFIKGPIDYEWIAKACKAGAAELGLYLMYKIGILGSKASVQVRPSECRELGLADRARQRQVVRLENAGLITADKGTAVVLLSRSCTMINTCSLSTGSHIELSRVFFWHDLVSFSVCSV